MITPPVSSILAAATRLQAAYEAGRKAYRTAFERLHAEGAFHAPEHLRPALRGELAFAGPLTSDPQRAEAG